MEKCFQKIIWLNLVLVLLLAADRLAKTLSLRKLPVEGVSLISGWLKLNLFFNHHIAFGLSLPPVWLYSLIILILLWLIILSAKAYQQKDGWLVFWLGLVIAGALGNLIDRWLYGYVVDFIEVPFWSVFNLADAMIVLGLFGWLIKKLKRQK